MVIIYFLVLYTKYHLVLYTKKYGIHHLTGVLCTSRFHLFVELDVGVVEQLGYLVHVLPNWIVELAPSAVTVAGENVADERRQHPAEREGKGAVMG